ncbi:MAG TPA: hypothetical protein GX507_08165 [Clostridia bacterium]|nr:hypothetical protein [Clostridia bacterium]
MLYRALIELCNVDSLESSQKGGFPLSIPDRLLALWVYVSLTLGAFAGLGAVAEGGGDCGEG